MLFRSSGNYPFNSGNYIRFGHGNQTDGNDGVIGASIFSSGLNIVGTQTVAGEGRVVRVWGNLMNSGGTQYVYNSGTWGISISGNAATATTATTAGTVTNGVYTTGDQSIAGQKTFTGKIRMQSNLGLDAGNALYFGYEEGFGGTDTGGVDYGYITYDNNNSTYGTGGGETSTLRIGTQNDGDGSVGDHVAIEAAANI